ncbi:hypothetical protein CsSME_00035077 [Camellia sinensis var. sinensis]
MKHVGSTPQKRARAISPTLSRQKSFRREPERTNSTYSVSNLVVVITTREDRELRLRKVVASARLCQRERKILGH